MPSDVDVQMINEVFFKCEIMLYCKLDPLLHFHYSCDPNKYLIYFIKNVFKVFIYPSKFVKLKQLYVNVF